MLHRDQYIADIDRVVGRQIEVAARPVRSECMCGDAHRPDLAGFGMARAVNGAMAEPDDGFRAMPPSRPSSASRERRLQCAPPAPDPRRRSSSTTTSPRSVLIRVPATKHGVTPFTDNVDPSVTDAPNCSVPASALDGSNSVSTCVAASKLVVAIDVPCTTIESPATKFPIVAANPPSVPIVSTPVRRRTLPSASPPLTRHSAPGRRWHRSPAHRCR